MAVGRWRAHFISIRHCASCAGHPRRVTVFEDLLPVQHCHLAKTSSKGVAATTQARNTTQSDRQLRSLRQPIRVNSFAMNLDLTRRLSSTLKEAGRNGAFRRLVYALYDASKVIRGRMDILTSGNRHSREPLSPSLKNPRLARAGSTARARSREPAAAASRSASTSWRSEARTRRLPSTPGCRRANSDAEH